MNSPTHIRKRFAEHRRALREAFARYGGVEVDTQGDAFFVAFARASDAVAGAEEGGARLPIGLSGYGSGCAPASRP